MEMNGPSMRETEDLIESFHADFKKFHEDLKKWQRSNEKSSRRIFWASVAMIILVAAQIILTVCF